MKILLLCLFFVLSQISFGQDFKLKSFSIVDGLPQSQVFDIAEDHNGNLWLATRGGGIAKFDGANFKVFTTQDGLVNNFASAIFHDSKENIWVGTSNGVSLYNGIRFRNYKLEGQSFKVSVSSITENKKQELFFGFSDTHRTVAVHAARDPTGIQDPRKAQKTYKTKVFFVFWYGMQRKPVKQHDFCFSGFSEH